MYGGTLYIRNIKELEGFTIDPRHIINSKFVFNNRWYIDYNWIEKQMEYIHNLSDRQKHVLRAYTIYGDKFINNYLRGTLTRQLIGLLLDDCKRNNENPFLYQHKDKTGSQEIDNEYQENILEYIDIFIKEITKIIKDSPKLEKEIKVFRGLKDGNFIVSSLQKNNKGRQFLKSDDFMSTTMYLPSAAQFMNGDCCILELTLEIGTPCIFIASVSRRQNEFEILLPPGMIMKYKKCTRKFMLTEWEHYQNIDVFIYPGKYYVPIIRMCEFSVQPM